MPAQVRLMPKFLAILAFLWLFNVNALITAPLSPPNGSKEPTSYYNGAVNYLKNGINYMQNGISYVTGGALFGNPKGPQKAIAEVKMPEVKGKGGTSVLVHMVNGWHGNLQVQVNKGEKRQKEGQPIHMHADKPFSTDFAKSPIGSGTKRLLFYFELKLLLMGQFEFGLGTKSGESNAKITPNPAAKTDARIGDTVGCGLAMELGKDKGQVFFTRNGKQTERNGQPTEFEVDIAGEKPYFPLIIFPARSEAVLFSNFGENGFEFAIESYTPLAWLGQKELD